MLNLQKGIKLAKSGYAVYKKEGFQSFKDKVKARLIHRLSYPRTLLFFRGSLKFAKFLIKGQLLQKFRAYGGVRKTIYNFLKIQSTPIGAGAPLHYCLRVPLSYSFKKWTTPPSIAVICHMYYVDLIEEISAYLNNIPYSFDLFITTDCPEKRDKIEKYYLNWPKGSVTVKIAQNRGRDIAPKLIEFADVYSCYEFFLHIHTKKTPQIQGNGWRNYLFETLLGSEKIIYSIFEIFKQNKSLGMIAPDHSRLVRHCIGWGGNFEICQQFAERLGIELYVDNQLDFPSGSMFWGRSASIKSLIEANLNYEDFPPEDNQMDATLAHAIERLYFLICEHNAYKWIKIGINHVDTDNEKMTSVKSSKDLIEFINTHQYELLHQRVRVKPYLSHLEKIAYENSDYNFLNFLDFQYELIKLREGKPGIIDFDEKFYLSAHKDVAEAVLNKSIPYGYIHYCLKGKEEGRVWSNNQLKHTFAMEPHYPKGFFSPVNIYSSDAQPKSLPILPESNVPFLLVLFSHLQDDIFYGGYTAFFTDFLPVFGQFKKIILSVEAEVFNPELAKRYASHIEVIHQSELGTLNCTPTLIICFNCDLFHRALRLFKNPGKIIYYCQEFEACAHPLGDRYIEVERAIYKAQNIILSTEILKKYLISRNLITEDKKLYITSPKIEPIDVIQEKKKKLFFYFRPERFNLRNLSNLLRETAEEFCKKHRGYTIYMVGTVNTRYSYEVNGTQIFVLSKLSKQQYFDLIASCDVVISMIYAAHPGIIAYQAAASGIPSITNTFDNRDKAFLKKISKNIVPYDPIRDDLLELIEYALTLPKGHKHFNEKLYTGQQEGTLLEYVSKICDWPRPNQPKFYLKKEFHTKTEICLEEVEEV
ncbi:Rhamnan synthesis protein F [Legionella busanensis]|uniref:Rhamnan synthesis protein F n=1 Tax=Legionella busanensis TaxID=190655 RepID=A0A378JQ09_9GAMM|nr:rhamnan synthesis F family protein [Legionella busanensis]STX50212.1 Rhamnan synthesis protein F [Legionella busanensis]